ncbi:MAG: hypothetical protein RLY20_70 [Verrucomicrobiota bacterium]|jgi:hypothetical protein
MPEYSPEISPDEKVASIFCCFAQVEMYSADAVLSGRDPQNIAVALSSAIPRLERANRRERIQELLGQQRQL